MKKNFVKTASKVIRNGSKRYIGYCNECAHKRANARKDDSAYDSKMFAKALVGGAVVYLTVAAVDFAIDAAPMVADKLKKAARQKSELAIETMRREMAMRQTTLESKAKFTDYYVSGDTLKMTNGDIPGDVIAEAYRNAADGTLPRIILGNPESDEKTDEIYTVNGQPKCCPNGEDPVTTEHEKDVTFPMFGDEHIEE